MGQEVSGRDWNVASASFELKPGFPLRKSRETAGILTFGPSCHPSVSTSFSQASKTDEWLDDVGSQLGW